MLSFCYSTSLRFAYETYVATILVNKAYVLIPPNDRISVFWTTEACVLDANILYRKFQLTFYILICANISDLCGPNHSRQLSCHVNTRSPGYSLGWGLAVTPVQPLGSASQIVELDASCIMYTYSRDWSFNRLWKTSASVLLKTVRTTKWNWNKNSFKTVLKPFCSVSFRCADSLIELYSVKKYEVHALVFWSFGPCELSLLGHLCPTTKWRNAGSWVELGALITP